MRWARTNPRRARRAFGLSLVGAALLLAGPLAARSHAGVYAATECSSANGYSQAQYGERSHHMQVVYRDCGAGGNGLAITLPQPYSAGGAGRWTLYAPPATHMVSVTGAIKGVSADGWWAWTAACSPWSCVTAGPYNFGTWQGFGFGPGYYTNWWVELGCAAPACPGGQSGVFARDVSMVMSDDAPPTLQFAQNSELLNGELQRGAGGLGLTPEDAGAGLATAWVLVNDQEVARQNYSCGGPPMQPCPSNGGMLNLQLDTQNAPFHNGQNTVQACAADYGAPPNATCTHETVVNVDNSCTDSKVPGGSSLSAFFARSRSDTVGVKAGQGALLTGQLTNSSGDPIPGASLCMKEGVEGQGLEGVGTVTTNSAGRYRYGVAPGPNRRLQVGYRYNRRQLERGANFFSRLRPKLKLFPNHKTRNGKRLRLYGSIPGPSSSDRVVIMQARYPHSSSWNTFAKAKTDARGRYVANYRFTATFVTTQYGMRAVVPKQNGYPYQGGVSRVRKIRVIGGRPNH